MEGGGCVKSLGCLLLAFLVCGLPSLTAYKVPPPVRHGGRRHDAATRYKTEVNGPRTPHPAPPSRRRVTPLAPNTELEGGPRQPRLKRRADRDDIGRRQAVLGITAAMLAVAGLGLPPVGSSAAQEEATASGPAAAAAAGGKGYLRWRALSEVESRAKDGNRNQTTYSPRFVTYLSRFLVNYDDSDSRFWNNLASEIPFNYAAPQVEETRRRQFASIADSVEIGLYDYQGKEGAVRLCDLLVQRYGDNPAALKQLAILFSFMEKDQPVEKVTSLLAQVQNATVTAVRVTKRGDGYTGEAPRVTIRSRRTPDAQPALARAVLRDTGSLRRIDIEEAGCIYLPSADPVGVTISPPPTRTGRQAKGIAVLDGKGGVKQIIITDRGTGYRADHPIRVSITMNDEPVAGEGDATAVTVGCTGPARARAVLDREVAGIEVVNGGSGYVVPLGLRVEIEPPVACGGEADGRPAEAAAVLTPVETLSPSESGSVGSSSTVGIGSNEESFSAQLQQLLPPETLLDYDRVADRYVVRGFVEMPLPPPSPLPMAVSMVDPFFGPIGKLPLEKERELKLENYVRLALSGGICIMLCRVGLTPLEVVKTKLQAQPEVYNGWSKGIAKLRAETENPFFRAVDATAMTGFVMGLLSFGWNEFFRRAFTELVGPGRAEVYQIPIILGAAVMATTITACAICPLESVRIRTMNMPYDSGWGGFLPVWRKLVAAGGWRALYEGIQPLLFREVPFQLTKFLVYDSAQAAIYSLLPAAKEAVSTSLAVSFASGLLAGVAGAVTGCPADAVMTRISTSDDVDWRGVVKKMLSSEGGWRNLFAGLRIRMIFFPLLISIQFFLYEYIKKLFGVAADDLTLVLDVISSATSGNPQS